MSTLMSVLSSGLLQARVWLPSEGRRPIPRTGHHDDEHDDENEGEGVDGDGGHEEQRKDGPREQCLYNPKEGLMGC